MQTHLRDYSNLQDMYERYSTPARKIRFEQRVYRFKGVKRNFDHFIHLYHCESERHFIVVYLRYNLPVLIKPIYSIDKIQLAELRGDEWWVK